MAQTDKTKSKSGTSQGKKKQSAANNTKNSKNNTAKAKKEATTESSPKIRKTYAEKQQMYALCFISVGILLCCFALIPGIKVWASIRGFLFAVF